MNALPYVLAFICLGCPALIIGLHLYDMHKLGKELDQQLKEYRDDNET